MKVAVLIVEEGYQLDRRLRALVRKKYPGMTLKTGQASTMQEMQEVISCNDTDLTIAEVAIVGTEKFAQEILSSLSLQYTCIYLGLGMKACAWTMYH